MPTGNKRAIRSFSFLLLCFLSFLATPSFGSDEEGTYRERVPSEERMKGFREEGPYHYPDGNEDAAERSFLSRIGTWIEDHLYSPMESVVNSGPILRYILIALGLGLLILYLWKNGAMSAFRHGAAKEAGSTVRFSGLEMEAESPLRKARDAEKKGDPIDALRWRYIHIVQTLGRKGLIRTSSHRTDREYLADLRGSGLEEAFENLSRFFQLVRYGDRSLNEEDYREWKERFKELERRIKQHEG